MSEIDKKGLDDNTKLNVFEAFALLSVGIKLRIYVILFCLICIVFVAIYREHWLGIMFKFIYSNVQNITPLISLMTLTTIIWYMFTNGRIMAYMKMLPNMLNSFFSEIRLENKSWKEQMTKDFQDMKSDYQFELDCIKKLVNEQRDMFKMDSIRIIRKYKETQQFLQSKIEELSGHIKDISKRTDLNRTDIDKLTATLEVIQKQHNEIIKNGRN